MIDTAKSAQILGDNAEAIADSPLSALNLPGRTLKLLEGGGFANVGDLAMRLEDEPRSILAISGIGPKALLDIQAALESLASAPGEEYHEPVQSLGDQFKSVPPAVPRAAKEEVKPEEKAMKDKEMKDEKSNKKDKKPKKADKKKDKESKMADKKKDKKPKKDDKKKDKKKNKKSGKKKKK
jgi:hypothetical protein